MNGNRASDTKYLEVDVAICGGGLAGLTLARQIRRELPDRSVAVIDRLARPLPEAALKVGESTVELGAHYLSEKLGLSDYYDEKHLHKLGLRFFFGEGTTPFHERPEYGISSYPGVNSYQIDRGILEQDLRDFNEAAGVTLIEGARLYEIRLNEGDVAHEIVYKADGESERQTLRARWVVDAMGRRRFLQKQLGLTQDGAKKHSSAWFRVKGILDVSDFVAQENVAWHERVPDGRRYLSTNHLMGNGYWIWIIPLSSGYTSIGIVAREDLHPFAEYNTYARSTEWLERHQPLLAERIADMELLDFRCMRKYTYSSKQVFSIDRWSCVGESGLFADPFYSPGTDMIGFSNSITTEMIRQDFENRLSAESVTNFNRFLIGYNNALTQNIHLGYPFFDNATVASAKIIWDTCAGWALACPQMFNSIYLDPEKGRQTRMVSAPFFSLSSRIQRLFTEWAEKSPGRLTFEFLDYLQLEFLDSLRTRNLRSGKSIAELVADQKENMERMEEFAQVLFVLAVEDTMPEYLDRLPDPLWVNAWRVSLKPDNWEKDGLFKARTERRDLGAMHTALRAMFREKEPVSV